MAAPTKQDMPKYITIFDTVKPCNQSAYPALFRHLLAIPSGVRFTDCVMAFESNDDAQTIKEQLHKFLDVKDGLIVFELSGGAWTIRGDSKDVQLRSFLGEDDCQKP